MSLSSYVYVCWLISDQKRTSWCEAKAQSYLLSIHSALSSLFFRSHRGDFISSWNGFLLKDVTHAEIEIILITFVLKQKLSGVWNQTRSNGWLLGVVRLIFIVKSKNIHISLLPTCAHKRFFLSPSFYSLFAITLLVYDFFKKRWAHKHGYFFELHSG